MAGGCAGGCEDAVAAVGCGDTHGASATGDSTSGLAGAATDTIAGEGETAGGAVALETPAGTAEDGAVALENPRDFFALPAREEPARIQRYSSLYA